MSETTTPAAGTATATPAPNFDDFAAEVRAAAKPQAEKPAEDAKPTDEEPAEKPAESAPEEPDSEEEDEKPETDEAEDSPKPEEDAPVTVSKQLAAINRAKARADQQIAQAKEALQREKAEVEGLRQKYAKYDERLASYENAAKRAKYDLPGLVKHLGVTDYVEAARQLYYASPAGAEKHPEEAQRYQRTSQIDEVAAQAKAEVEKLRAELETERAQVRKEKAIAGFLDEAKTHHAKAPLTAKLASAKPAKYRAEVEAAAIALHAKGEQVTAQKVIAAVEADLREIAGLSSKTTTAAPKTQSQPSRETKTAPSLGSDTQKSRPATSTAVFDPDDFAARVKAGNLDG